jgi:hypothetical protein
MTTDSFDTDDLNILLGLVNSLMNTTMTIAELRERAQRRAAAYRQRVSRNHARYQAMLQCMTDAQTARLAQQTARGYKINKMLQDLKTGKVAAMLVNDNLWNGEKGKIGTKIMLVYADGTTQDTFEKKINPDLNKFR